MISDIGLDIQDDMGRHEVGFKDNTQKFPENDDTGCRMESHFLINKVRFKNKMIIGLWVLKNSHKNMFQAIVHCSEIRFKKEILAHHVSYI